MRSSTTKWFVQTIVTCALGAATWGCTIEAGVDVPPTNRPPPNTPSGTLTQRWSIGGRFDQRSCSTFQADRMQLVIRDAYGQIAATAFQPCEEMEMSVRLPTGSYTGEAWFISSSGARVSTTLNLQPFTIARSTETFIDTDFPISSLHTAYGRLESTGEALESTDDALESTTEEDVAEETN
jgi:hypothetical protein